MARVTTVGGGPVEHTAAAEQHETAVRVERRVHVRRVDVALGDLAAVVAVDAHGPDRALGRVHQVVAGGRPGGGTGQLGGHGPGGGPGGTGDLQVPALVEGDHALCAGSGGVGGGDGLPGGVDARGAQRRDRLVREVHRHGAAGGAGAIGVGAVGVGDLLAVRRPGGLRRPLGRRGQLLWVRAVDVGGEHLAHTVHRLRVGDLGAVGRDVRIEGVGQELGGGAGADVVDPDRLRPGAGGVGGAERRIVHVGDQVAVRARVDVATAGPGHQLVRCLVTAVGRGGVEPGAGGVTPLVGEDELGAARIPPQLSVHVVLAAGNLVGAGPVRLGHHEPAGAVDVAGEGDLRAVRGPGDVLRDRTGVSGELVGVAAISIGDEGYAAQVVVRDKPHSARRRGVGGGGDQGQLRGGGCNDGDGGQGCAHARVDQRDILQGNGR